MTGNEYQKLAARTINQSLTFEEQKIHALHGMVGEIGEIHSIYQKMYQGHAFEVDHVKKEFGDLLWFIAEYCTAKGWSLDDIMQKNIDKLKARYLEGFLVDPKNGDYDTVGILYAVTPQGEKVEINRYFKETPVGFDEINEKEYLERKESAKVRLEKAGGDNA